MITWKKELPKVHKMLTSGKTQEEIASFYGVTKQQIGNVRKRYFPELDRAEFGCSLKKRERDETWKTSVRARFGRDTYMPSSELQAAQSLYFTRKRQNTKHAGKWEFTIGMGDLDWPDVCPVLGMDLDWFAEYRKENSPSIDRIDSNEGYVPGNVQIISWRANRIKNNGTAEEHEKIAQFLRKHEK